MIALITTKLGGGDGDSSGGNGGGSDRAGQVKQEQDDDRPIPKTYEVQSGDTLTSIARETGVPVAVIVKLNPGVDPQILIAGEVLKLK
ncbi:MAG: LysM domain-containing protein [Solirubrobacterales bacterium]